MGGKIGGRVDRSDRVRSNARWSEGGMIGFLAGRLDLTTGALQNFTFAFMSGRWLGGDECRGRALVFLYVTYIIHCKLFHE